MIGVVKVSMYHRTYHHFLSPSEVFGLSSLGLSSCIYLTTAGLCDKVNSMSAEAPHLTAFVCPKCLDHPEVQAMPSAEVWCQKGHRMVKKEEA